MLQYTLQDDLREKHTAYISYKHAAYISETKWRGEFCWIHITKSFGFIFVIIDCFWK